MSYAFPTNLTVEEIHSCLLELGITNFDPNQMTKPTTEAVRNYYEQAVLALMGISRDELVQPDFSALMVMEYPELHDESIPTLNFYARLTRLMVVCGIKDFNLNDVYKPEPSRLKRNLCAIINLGKFRDEKVAMLDEFEQVLAEKAKQEQELMAEQEKNLAELQRLKAHYAARQAEAKAIQEETAAIATKNMQLNKVHTVVSEEKREEDDQLALPLLYGNFNVVQIRSINAQRNALTDQAAEAKLTLSSLHSEAMELQDQIVQSPEKHRQAISDLMAAVENQREYYAAMTSTVNDYERKLDVLAKFDREVQRCIKLLEDLEISIAKKKEVSGNVKDTKEAIANEDRRAHELQSTNATGKRQVQSLTEKLSRMEQQTQLKTDAAEALLEEHKRRLEVVKAEKAAGGARVAERQAQIRHTRESEEEVRAVTEARVKAEMDKMNALWRAVTEYHKRLEAVMSNPDVAMAMEAWMADTGAEDLGALPDVAQGRDNGGGVFRGHAALLSTGMQRLALG